MPAYHVERSTTIDAPIARVRPAIEDYHQWPKWSPWLCCEPDCKLEFFGTPGQPGHGYKWDGKVVGAGQMKLRSNNGQMEMDLDFIRPFKSHADVRMVLSSMGENQAQVTWHMDGKMPFFLFFLVGMMKSMIGMDFERGLRMLKEYLETGIVDSHSKFAGVIELPETHYVGVTDHCNMIQIGDSMKRTLPQAHRIVVDNQMEVTGKFGAIYNKVDRNKQELIYTAFFPVKTLKQVPGAVSGTMGNCKALKVIHTGAYENLGNAWSMIMAHQRYKKHKLLKAQPAFEIYVNDPNSVKKKLPQAKYTLPTSCVSSKTHDVFISYSSKDRSLTNVVCAHLESNGIRCWIAPRDIVAGNDWSAAVVDAIKTSKLLILIFSKSSNESPQVKREIERAVAKSIAVIPFRIDEIAPSSSLEYFISTSHWLDAFTPPVEGHIQKLTDTVQGLLGKAPPRKTNSPTEIITEVYVPIKS